MLRQFVGRIAPIAIGVLLPVLAAAQSSGSITGRVLATDRSPVAGAFILADGSARPVAQTGDDGRFVIENVASGSHVLEVRRIGFANFTTTVSVLADAPTSVEVILTPTPSSLVAVTVIGSTDDIAEMKDRVARVPGGAALIDGTAIRSTRQTNLNEVLRLTPGVFVQPRFGSADESQISVRGSGLRNNFHARGINLLVNGMPYRNADGFTDFESLELLTTESIEIYKGANALRFGGSTLGGAINLSTKTGHTATPLSVYAQAGSFGFYKTQVASGAVSGPFDYYASYARTSMDGYREWSDQRRDRVNLHAGYRLNETTDARLFYFFAKVKEHLPGTVSWATLDSAPRSAAPGNVQNRWGRDYDLHHVGIQFRSQMTRHQRLEISPYLQYRDIDHPIFEVINQQSNDWGAEVRYENSAAVSGRANRLTVGVQPAYESMHNRQFQNNRGEHGNLTRDERDRATALAVYAENALSVTPRLTAVLGARLDQSTRKVDDDFLSNGDQSDTRTYKPLTPRVGLLYSSGAQQLFANASKTVEPPLFLELSSFGNSGGFIDLDAQEATQYEIGARSSRRGFAWEMSLYDVELKNEILNRNVQPFPGAPFTVPTYRNSPRTRHYGVEAGGAWQRSLGVFTRNGIPDRVTTRLAYTYARYKYVRDADYEGNDIPGAPAHYLAGEVAWFHPVGLTIAPGFEWVPTEYFINSTNTSENPRWANLTVRAELAMANGLSAQFSAQNLWDRRMSRSVQVDNAAGTPYEPADGRSFYAGLRWSR